MHRRRARAPAFPILAAFLVILCLASGLPSAARADGVDTLNLLSYNVRNLPGTGFDTRRAAIEALFPGFDLVLLQEDFEPAPLRAAWPDPARLAHGPEAVFRWYHLLAPVAWAAGHPVPYDSGLSVMAAKPKIAGLKTIARHPYPVCHGTFGASLDCWATKGLLGARVSLANGTEVDVYTTHLDAGGHPASAAARRRQLADLVDRIATISAGRAVILAGDFNAPRRRPDDLIALEEALTALGLTSAGARARNRASDDCQVVHIYYRSAPGTTVEVLAAGELPVPLPEQYAGGMNFCSSDRRVYGPSDHPALAATFRVKPEFGSAGAWRYSDGTTQGEPEP
jgi:endonuclease/exonuclease/phosphatase family metal-dependent hydrolase